ncbi:MAG: hypothetical protein J5657_05510 [Clostridiales bacterium]|nr:hypothetical protein [Clostridiales bacterium]
MRNVRALRSVVLLMAAALMAGAVMYVSPARYSEAAAPSVSYEYRKEDNWEDGANFKVKLRNFQEGAEVVIELEFPHELADYQIHYPTKNISADRPKGTHYDDSFLSFKLTYHKSDFNKGDFIEGTAWGMGLGLDRAKATLVEYHEPKATPTPTTAPTSTPVPTARPLPTNTPVPTARPVVTAVPTRAPSLTPTPVAARTVTPTATPTEVPVAAVTAIPTEAPTEAPTVTPTLAPDGSSATTTTEESKATTTAEEGTTTTTLAEETTSSSEETSAADIPVVIAGRDEKVPSDPSDPSEGGGGTDGKGPAEVVLTATAPGKNNKGSFWMLAALFVLLFLIGRYIYLNKIRKYSAKESLIRLIPGVPALYCNVSKNMLDSQIAAEAAMAAQRSSSQTSFNTASAKKAVRDMEEGSAPALKTAPVTPIKSQDTAAKNAPAEPAKIKNTTAVPERNNRMDNASPKLTPEEKEAIEKAAKAKEEAEAAARRAAQAKAEAEKAAAEMEEARKAAEAAEAKVSDTTEKTQAITTTIGGKTVEEETKNTFKSSDNKEEQETANKEPEIPKKPVWEKEEKDTSYRASIVNFEHRKPDSDEVNALGSALSKSKTPPPASARPKVRANWDNYGGASPFKPVGQDEATGAVAGFVSNASSGSSSDSKSGAGKTFRKNIDSDEPTSFTSGSSRKAAFFNKAKHSSSQPEQREESESVYGGIRRPNSAGKKEEEDSAPALGKALEGKRPSILNSSIPMGNAGNEVDGKDVQEG